MHTNRLYPIEASFFDLTTLTNVYQLVTIIPFAEPCNLIRLVNTSGVAIMVSYDADNDHEVVLAHDDITISAQGNKRPAWPNTKFARGTKVYVKYILGAAKSGSMIVIGYHQ